MKTLFDGVYAPSTVGTLLREFTFGHARQLESVLREHLVRPVRARSICWPGPTQQVFIDIDSLLRPVYGHAKQGASYGHTKIAGKQVLRKGLSPLATTISTAQFGAGDRRDAAARRARPARARAPGGWSPRRSAPPAPPAPPGRSWSAATRPTATARWCARACAHGAQFSLVMTRNAGDRHARSPRSPTHAWTPVRYPGAVRDPDTGAWISDAEVAEIAYTAFASTNDRITARLVVRRVKDARYPDALFPVWRYHPFFTNTDLPVDAGRHHPPPTRDHRNRVRRPDRRTAGPPALGTLRRQLRLGPVRRDRPQPAARRRRARRRPPHPRTRIDAAPHASSTSPPDWPDPQRRPILHLPTHWPWSKHWLALWHNTIGHSPPLTATP